MGKVTLNGFFIKEISCQTLPHYGYSTGFYPLTTVHNLLSMKDTTDHSNKFGVYQILFSECTAIYVKQTGRKFRRKTPLETQTFHSNTNGNTAVAHHCLNNNYNRSKLTGRLLHVCNKTYTMNR